MTKRLEIEMHARSIRAHHSVAIELEQANPTRKEIFAQAIKQWAKAVFNGPNVTPSSVVDLVVSIKGYYGSEHSYSIGINGSMADIANKIGEDVSTYIFA